MTATLLNKQMIKDHTYYDLLFTENKQTMLRLIGVSFIGEVTETILNDRVTDIFTSNFSDITILNEIIIL